jgi:hypothetical protein
VYKKEVALKKMKEKKGEWEEIRPPLKKGMTMTQKHKIDLKQRGKDMK